jgi:hypothetical protein
MMTFHYFSHSVIYVVHPYLPLSTIFSNFRHC